jgi:uncharacterized phiE125 gp8 family phage protein
MPIDAAVAMVTLEDVRSWLKFEPGSNDDVLADIANAVSADCAKVCGRAWLQKVYADALFDGDGTDRLLLPHTPVTAVTKLIPFTGATQLVEGPDKDFVWYPNGKVQLLNGYFPRAPKGVTVSYAGGYTLALIPHDVRVSVLEAVAFVWNSQDKRREGITSITTADGITTYTEHEYPESVTRKWSRWRKTRIAGIR